MDREFNIAVLGDGGWGTTLAIMLAKKGLEVSIWGAFVDYTSYLDKKRVNSRFLPGVAIPKNIKITSDIASALEGKQLVVLAVPSQYMRSVLEKIKESGLGQGVTYVSVSKGIEIKSLKTMSALIREELGNVKLAVLSGPTIANEVVRGIPTAAVIASKDKRLRKELQCLFMGKRFRVYTNDDLIGVELAGALKNIIAIACGISDGLGFGTNTKAALLSRGLAEIARLGVAMGARRRTFSGISGLGDLVTTCISSQSRNRFVGEQIGKGKSLREIRAHMRMVAEGVPTAKSAYLLGLKYKVELPITSEVYRILYKNKPALKAVGDLMARQGKEEE